MIAKQIHHYKIIEKIGAGGMGEVFLAEDTKLERKVALKFLPPSFTNDPDFRSRFEHEAKASAALDHPNIVTVYELGEHDGRMYIAMQYIDGEALDKKIELGTLNITKALDVAEQLCAGLGAAHDAEIVHRDIKPANIIVTDDGVVKILDFGLAKSHRATTETKVGSTLGTVHYDSPEQSRGEQVDRRSDLFAVGVLLYEIITGKLPFSGEYEEAIRYSISNEEAHPLSRFAANVPDEVQRIVSKLLQKDRTLRYQSADDVISDLRLLKQNSSVTQAKTVSPRTKSLPAIATVAIVAALALGAIKFWPTGSGDETSAPPRVAVLPFENLGLEADEYFADGITDAITSRLARISALRVISRTSVMQYKDTEKPLKQIGAELGVDYILEGTKPATPIECV